MQRKVEGHYEKQYENIVQSKLYQKDNGPESEWVLEWIDIRGKESAKSFKTNEDACAYYINLKYGNQEMNKALDTINKDNK